MDSSSSACLGSFASQNLGTVLVGIGDGLVIPKMKELAAQMKARLEKQGGQSRKAETSIAEL